MQDRSVRMYIRTSVHLYLPLPMGWTDGHTYECMNGMVLHMCRDERTSHPSGPMPKKGLHNSLYISSFLHIFRYRFASDNEDPEETLYRLNSGDDSDGDTEDTDETDYDDDDDDNDEDDYKNQLFFK